jgi:hypothetical protein
MKHATAPREAATATQHPRQTPFTPPQPTNHTHHAI